MLFSKSKPAKLKTTKLNPSKLSPSKINPSKLSLLVALWTTYGFINLFTANIDSTGIPRHIETSDFNTLPNLSPMPFMYSEFIFNPSNTENPKKVEKISEEKNNNNKIVYRKV